MAILLTVSSFIKFSYKMEDGHKKVFL